MSFVDEQRNLENNLKDNTCNGQCSKCGDCCGLFIPFTKKELSNIKRYVELHNIKQEDRIDKMTGSFKAHCCFLDEKTWTCKIYPVRPYTCRDFICNRKNWKEKRELYAIHGDYNGYTRGHKKTKKLASFDDLIYNDYVPIIRYLLNVAKDDDGWESRKIVEVFRAFGREDVLKYITGTNEQGEKFDGTTFKDLD